VLVLTLTLALEDEVGLVTVTVLETEEEGLEVATELLEEGFDEVETELELGAELVLALALEDEVDL